MKKLIVFCLFSVLFAIACSPSSQEGGDSGSELDDSESSAYLNKGGNIVATLSSRLFNRLNQQYAKTQSVPQTTKYCKVVAYDLIDTTGKSMAQSVRRVSLKVRNMKDEPTDLEREILKEYQTKQMRGDTLLPSVREIDAGTIGYFHPIRVQQTCLKCHGILGEDIMSGDYAAIKELYPNDRAVGYREGDIRGMWSIYLNK